MADERPLGRGRPALGVRGRVAAAAVILAGTGGLVAFAIDWRRILALVAGAHLPTLAIGVLLAFAGIACWSEAVRRLLPPEGRAVSPTRGFLVYAAGSMVRNVLPVGYASSIGVLSVVYRREAALSIHRSLAAVSVAELLVAGASLCVTTAGVLLLGVLGPATPLLRWVALGVAAVAIGIAVAGALAWTRRRALERAVRVIVRGFASLLGRLTPGLGGRLSPVAIERSVGEYATALSRVSARRRTLVIAFGLGLSGWLALVASLYASGLAAGIPVPIAVAVLVVPIAGYATVLPVPGGLGGYELAVAGVLHYLGGIDLAAALAVTLLFRLCSYWAVIALGGVAAAALSVDVRRLAAAAMDTGGAEMDPGGGDPPS